MQVFVFACVCMFVRMCISYILVMKLKVIIQLLGCLLFCSVI